MTRLIKSCLAAAVLLTAPGCAGMIQEGSMSGSVRGSYSSGGPAVDEGYFYAQLSPYGRWFEQPGYGWCWVPNDVPYGWRPYSNGYWVYTDFGWTWNSNDPWGWATCHYGRWFDDPTWGWSWVPGTEWGPAWVAWRESDDWVGWCPLPPDAGWNVSVGLSFSSGGSDRLPSDDWCFVDRRRVFDRNIRAQLLPIGRNVTLIERTRDATRFESRDGRPVNNGVDVAVVERATGRGAPRYKVVDSNAPGRSGSSAGNGTVAFFKPSLRPAPPRSAPPEDARQEPPGRTMPRAPVFQQQRDAEQRRVDAWVQGERQRLEREQKQEELQAPARGESQADMQRRHEAEKRAFEARAQRERQLAEHKVAKRFTKGGRSHGQNAQDNRDDDREKDKRKPR